jgi:Icc protein
MLVYFILGNHDDRRLMQKTFGDTHSHIPTSDGFLNYAIEDHPLRLVSLDSLINGEIWGIVDEAQCG